MSRGPPLRAPIYSAALSQVFNHPECPQGLLRLLDNHPVLTWSSSSKISASPVPLFSVAYQEAGSAVRMHAYISHSPKQHSSQSLHQRGLEDGEQLGSLWLGKSRDRQRRSTQIHSPTQARRPCHHQPSWHIPQTPDRAMELHP